ncbi:hypothetical protein PMES_00420 [Profundibacterium mesophilum KAUST100406-0324]|uniref:Uncharacterized protein n=2 Tax=Profundibacterium TaxID=1258570 RepID=A0A921NQP0_9RHOB|nr:hypothetical protein PMES_00420 [Profundibacterium mesophilum KAUST100406-0324]
MQAPDRGADGLLHAADLLGRPNGIRLARSVLEGCALLHLSAERINTACGASINLPVFLIVHDPPRIEAGRLAAPQPARPGVESIVTLANGLSDVLRA